MTKVKGDYGLLYTTVFVHNFVFIRIRRPRQHLEKKHVTAQIPPLFINGGFAFHAAMTAGEARTPVSDLPTPPPADCNLLPRRKVRSFGTSARRRRKDRVPLAGGARRSGPSEKVDGSVSARKLAAALRRVQVQDVGEVGSVRRSIVRDWSEV